jgi:hypothetical protein
MPVPQRDEILSAKVNVEGFTQNRNNKFGYSRKRNKENQQILNRTKKERRYLEHKKCYINCIFLLVVLCLYLPTNALFDKIKSQIISPKCFGARVWFLGVFTTMRKATIRLVMSVRSSVRPHETTRLYCMVFDEILYLSFFFSKICRENTSFIKI